MLGEQLRKARIAADLTQEEVAARARISREYMSKLEANAYSPTVDVLMRVCAAIGTSAWRVLRRLEESNAPKRPT